MPTPTELATTLLSSQSAALRTLYHPEFVEHQDRYGSDMARLLRPSKRKFQGSTLTVQNGVANSYGAQFTRNPFGAFPDPQTFESANYSVNMTEDPTTNHMAILRVSTSVSHMDIMRVFKKEIAPFDFFKKNHRQAEADVVESQAIHQYVPSTGLLATISGTPTKNDRVLLSDCASLTTSGGARFRIVGSLTFFPRGRRLSVYSSADVYRFDVQVTDFNPRDYTVGVWGLDANGRPSESTDLTGIAASDKLYVQNEKSQSPISVRSWLTAPTDGTTDSFFGRNREAAGYRWMQPRFSGPATARAFDLTDIDAGMIEAGYTGDSGDRAMLILGRAELIETYKRQIVPSTMVAMPTDEQKGKLLAAYGFSGAIYYNERVGRVMPRADPMVPDNELWGLVPGEWEMLYFIDDAIDWLPGEGLMGCYYRTTSPTGNGSRTNVYRADGESWQATICSRPGGQIVWKNLQPTATVSIPS